MEPCGAVYVTKPEFCSQQPLMRRLVKTKSPLRPGVDLRRAACSASCRFPSMPLSCLLTCLFSRVQSLTTPRSRVSLISQTHHTQRDYVRLPRLLFLCRFFSHKAGGKWPPSWSSRDEEQNQNEDLNMSLFYFLG